MPLGQVLCWALGKQPQTNRHDAHLPEVWGPGEETAQEATAVRVAGLRLSRREGSDLSPEGLITGLPGTPLWLPAPAVPALVVRPDN